MNNKLYKNLTLISLMILIISLILKNNIGKFVAPKMSIYIYISLPFLVLLLVNSIKNSNIKYKKNNKSILNYICIVPIILGIIGINGNLSNEYISFKAGTTRNKQNIIVNSSNSEREDSDENIDNNLSNNTENVVEEDIQVDNNSIEGLESEKIDITINDDVYIKMLDDMYNSIDKYIGKKIKVQGCAFRMDGMEKNQFAIGKYYMYCCAADMSLVGYLCEDSDDYSSIKNDNWYEVEGIITKHKYVDENNISSDEPMIKITSIKEIEKPLNTIVYY